MIIISILIVSNITTIILGYELMELYCKRGNQYETQR